MILLLALSFAASLQDDALDPPINAWVKRAPQGDTPASPRLGYEGDCVWDPVHRLVIRYGGHNQGGGGEQHSELWTFDLRTARWVLKEPNLSPPGVCCAQQNVFDPIQGRYLRFPSFSGSHGWQWHREIYLNGSAVWSYDLDENRWRNLSPLPAPKLAPLRCASWDREHQAVVLFGGEGSREGTVVYDPYANTWHRMDPPVQPEFRSGGNMTYDWVRRRHVLFGAQFSDDPRTWAYDLRKNQWTDLKPEGSPPTDKNDAVLAYDPVGDVVVAIVKQAKGKGDDEIYWLDTWVYDPAANRWKKMSPEREPTPTGNRARVLMSAPDLNLTLLENRPHPPRGPAEQQIWTYRTAAGEPRPSVPPKLLVTTTEKGAVLTWEASAPRTRVYRGAGDVPWKVQFAEIAQVEGNSYRDPDLIPGTIYHYYVAGAGESRRARTQPRPVDGLVVSALSDKEASLDWKRSPEPDVAGYHVERASVEVYSEDELKRLKGRTPPLAEPSVGAIRKVGPFRRITETPVREPAFVDRSVDFKAGSKVEGDPVFERTFPADSAEAGKPYRYSVYAYRVHAVNALGVASGPGPCTFTIPSSVQGLFAREEGATCHLKWSANPEKAIRGYRVYRMDGRFDKEPVSRLTADPILPTESSDPGAARKSRRYYVVAVDALGQEGAPSSPVWYEREWKKYYAPFTGEWHQ